MSTHARPLAVWLAAASDADLERLFAGRGVRPDAAWNDFFDAAEALLDPASVERAVSTLPRQDAAALARVVAGEDAGESRGRLLALALIDADGLPYPPVTESVAGRAPIASTGGNDPVASSDDATARAAEQAFATVARFADLLLAAREGPLALLATGVLAAGEKKRLAELGIDADDADELRAIAAAAALVRTQDRRVLPTADAEHWLQLPFADRWTRLAAAFRAALPIGIRSGDGWLAPGDWSSAYPWDPAWPAHAQHLHRRARLLGLIADDDTEPTWSARLRQGQDADAEPLARFVPVEVDRVFLQNDLTAIAPGPLLPALDVRLRGLVERDSAQSSSYRFTAESLTRGLVEGETEASIVEFLTALSLTGLPQPLAYLVSQTAQRHGLVRVWASEHGTTVTSADAHLIETMGVDRSLRPLALTPEDGMLTSRVRADTVYWALVDARYPATLVDQDGTPVSTRRAPAAVGDPAPSGPGFATLIARLREHQGPDADAAWLDRELEAAVRQRAVVVVEVGMPDGSSRELTLEASGLGGGRLRGRDRAADVERTLPVSSIRSARIVDATG
ncbi:helicase-associated domain-containing protein [Microbacterium sp. M28]|uniref:helicase-associated domain-containing protein n=1 Tax=Microbacterium sp. M28 TaxID=2962064 RepID=UPI0021F49853|nr:helicase-associated domain-containing protein [Microbacterium sp. M28]UYO97943.1 helicase-associated domain-containing protein [Microbacterium sp. M28]